jgi:hypothetical protein
VSDIEEATEATVEADVSGDDSGYSVKPTTEMGTDDADDDVIAIGSDSGLYARYGLDYPDIEDPGLEAALHGLSPSALPDPLPTSIDDIAGPGVALDDEELLDRAMNSKRGAVIEALYDGRDELWSGRDSRYPSQSEADMGLCFYLGFWTGGDPERMDRLFRNSGMYRGKWDRVHFANGATYGEFVSRERCSQSPTTIRHRRRRLHRRRPNEEDPRPILTPLPELPEIPIHCQWRQKPSRTPGG